MRAVHAWAARAAAVVAALVPACPLAACRGTNPNQTPNPNQNQNQVKVSPMPYGVAYRPDAPRPLSQVEGRSLDEALAYVEGRPVTRRRLVRETGGRPPGVDEEAFERSLQERLKQFVVEELFVREAQRVGLRVPEQALDEALANSKRRILEAAAERAGRPVAWEEYLADRGITEAEFRESIRRRGLQETYKGRVLAGRGPLRPQVEMEVSPAEVKRIYRAHPDAFDVKPGVKFVRFQVKFSKYLSTDVPVAEAEAAMNRAAAAIADGLRRGESPETIARRHDLARERGEWMETETFVPPDAETLPQVVGPEGVRWLFEPGRRAREAIQLEDPRGEGPIVLGVLEVQTPRQRDWDEIRKEIVDQVRLAREKRVEANLVIRMVTQGSVVWPQALADAIVEDARALIARIDQDPVLGEARFQ